MTTNEEVFTASNGIKIREYNRRLERLLKDQDEWTEIGAWNTGIQPSSHTGKALGEWYRAQEDKRLERIRYPKDPDIVAYPWPGDYVRLVNERSGAVLTVHSSQYIEVTSVFKSAAAWYFEEAVGSSKPWHEARDGEVWALEVDGETKIFKLFGDLFRTGTLHDIEKTDKCITEGERIWPYEGETSKLGI